MKIPRTICLLIRLSNISKNIVTKLKISDTIFNYLKKHTYESENTQDNFFAHNVSQIFKKHVYES